MRFEFGKRDNESLDGRLMNSDKNKSTAAIRCSDINISDVKYKVLLDYVFEHADNDQRPYLKISIMGINFLGLLDSGATRTIAGSTGWRLLKYLNLPLDTSKAINCTVANGSTCQSIGTVQTPVQLLHKVIILDILIVPSLPHTIILGLDFWKQMGIVPDLRNDVWSFSNSNITEVAALNSAEDLTLEQQQLLDQLISTKTISLSKNTLGCTNLVEHEIITDATPIKQRYYPVSPVVQSHIDTELTKMLEQGVIEPSKSPWSSPVLLVPKKDGTYRFVVDYRQLNKVTKKDAYPIPFVSAILDRLRNAHFLSSIDIKSAYWQVPVKESSREYTAFTVPGRGLFHFKRMPFGLTNAPATWQRLLDNVLGADLEPNVFYYLDDIIVVSPDFDTHLELLGKIFDRLAAANLTISFDKCQFCRPELKYLGYVVNKFGLQVDPSKVEAILNMPTPKTVSEIRRVLGMASWYRRFIPNFATITAPLTSLLRKSAKWNWNSDCESAFKTLKECLVSAPLLCCPDYTKPFVVQCDASAYGLGAVLTQNIDGEERVICYLSRSLTKSERKYTTTERECLAVLFAVEKLRMYLEGVHFTVITDHHSLTWLHRLKDPVGRLARWAVRMQQFSFDIVHRKGRENIVPDALSRSVPIIDAVKEDLPNEVKDPWYLKLRKKVSDNPLKFPQWRIEDDALLKYVKCRFPELRDPKDYWKRVVPKEQRNSILQKYHDDPLAGHSGVFKTFMRIASQYYWPKLKADIARYIKTCKVCAQYKPEQRAKPGLMGGKPKVDKPWQMVVLDLIGPLPRSYKGHRFILVVADYFSKFVRLFPLRSATSKSIVNKMEDEIFLLFGVPQFLVCDNGKQLTSKPFTNLCAEYNVKTIYNALYHPQTNPTERINRVVKTMIASYVNSDQRRWDESLSKFGCAIRTAVHEATGCTPYFINFGREQILNGREHTIMDRDPQPIETNYAKLPDRLDGFVKLYSEVRKKMSKSFERNKYNYNLRRRPVSYNVGDMVWRKSHFQSSAADYMASKLCAKFVGPYRIVRKTSTWTYELDEDGTKRNWHVKDLKEYHPRIEENHVSLI